MSVVIDGTQGVTSSGSFYGQTTFTGTYTDGIVVDYTTGTGRITVGSSDGLKIRNGGTASPTDLVTVDSSGNVGIGISSPATRLHVVGVEGDDAIIGSNSVAFKFGVGHTGNGTGYVNLYPTSSPTTSPTSLAFQMGGTERMRIDNSGNVGIGTSSPSNKLQVMTPGAGTPYAAFTGNADDPTLEFQRWTGTGSNYVSARIKGGVDGSGGISFSTGAAAAIGTQTYTERMRIDSSGNVGIGTSSPASKLHVNGDNGPLRVGGSGYVVNPTVTVIGQYTSTRGYIQMPSAGQFEVWNGGTGAVATFYNNGNFNCSGALSKGSGSFRIRHPLPSLSETHELVHSFIEGPQADNLYRGKVTLVSGSAAVNIDIAAGMTDGTFVILNREVQCFTTNETGWTAVRGSVAGNILTIEAQDNSCTDTISWMVIGERQDEHMMHTDWTDDNGKVIVEPLKKVQLTAAEESAI